METISWNIPISVNYNIDTFIEKTQKFIDNNNIKAEQATEAKIYCKGLIYQWLVPQDDLVFYSFKEEHYDEMIAKIFKKITFKD